MSWGKKQERGRGRASSLANSQGGVFTTLVLIFTMIKKDQHIKHNGCRKNHNCLLKCV